MTPEASRLTRIEDKLDELLDKQHRMELSLADGNYSRRLDGLDYAYGQMEIRLSNVEDRVEVIEKSEYGTERVEAYKERLKASFYANVGLLIAVLTLAVAVIWRG